MTTFRLEATVRLDTPLGEAFPFFSDAFALERLTPEWLRFVVATAPPVARAPSTRIEYRLRIRGIPCPARTSGAQEPQPPIVIGRRAGVD